MATWGKGLVPSEKEWASEAKVRWLGSRLPHDCRRLPMTTGSHSPGNLPQEKNQEVLVLQVNHSDKDEVMTEKLHLMKKGCVSARVRVCLCMCSGGGGGCEE